MRDEFAGHKTSEMTLWRIEQKHKESIDLMKRTVDMVLKEASVG